MTYDDDDDEDEGYPPNVTNLNTARQSRSKLAWHRQLHKDQNHNVKPISQNALVLFAHAPELKGLIAYDEFQEKFMLLRAPPPPVSGEPGQPGPYPRPWRRYDIVDIHAYFQRAWNDGFKINVIEDAMASHASRNRKHPVREWLAERQQEYQGGALIAQWVGQTFGTPSLEEMGPLYTPELRQNAEAKLAKVIHYREQVGAKFLIAAVRRVRQPGCKFDYMPVFEGDQGQGKSKSLRALFGEWFTDDLQDLRSKEAAISLQGAWGIEVAELDRLLRVEPETTKAFISRQTDRYRPPYGKQVEDFPRQNVLCGTTNRTDWLRDETGNRRYWPVRTYSADSSWIEANHEQLWAEAAAREAAGESIWLDDEDLLEVATAEQGERHDEDVWTPMVIDKLDELKPVEITTADLLQKAVSVMPERQTKREQMRMASILAKLGWQKGWNERAKKKYRVWLPPQDDAPNGDGGGANMGDHRSTDAPEQGSLHE